jgi:hypothetical protein
MDRLLKRYGIERLSYSGRYPTIRKRLFMQPERVTDYAYQMRKVERNIIYNCLGVSNNQNLHNQLA